MEDARWKILDRRRRCDDEDVDFAIAIANEIDDTLYIFTDP